MQTFLDTAGGMQMRNLVIRADLKLRVSLGRRGEVAGHQLMKRDFVLV